MPPDTRAYQQPALAAIPFATHAAHGQFTAEHAAFTEGSADAQFCIVAHRHMFGERKSHPGVAKLFRARIVDAMQALRQAQNMMRINTLAAAFESSPTAHRHPGQCNSAACRRAPQRIKHQIRQRAVNFNVVAAHKPYFQLDAHKHEPRHECAARHGGTLAHSRSSRCFETFCAVPSSCANSEIRYSSSNQRYSDSAVSRRPRRL